MNWQAPHLLLLAIPALGLLVAAQAFTHHHLHPLRQRLLFTFRALLLLAVILALASPALTSRSRHSAVVFVLDYSESLGASGVRRLQDASAEMIRRLPASVETAVVAVGRDATVLRAFDSGSDSALPDPPPGFDASQSNLASGLQLASAIFPAGASRQIVLLSDGQETAGSLEREAKTAAIAGVTLHALPIGGEERPDARISRLDPSQSRLTEGATLELTPQFESTFAGDAVIRLFENGFEVDRRNVTFNPGRPQTTDFQRSPSRRNIYTYRAVLEGLGDRDEIPGNNEALAVVDVQGSPLILYLEGEPRQDTFLVEAMAREGIRLESRPPQGLPSTLRELAGFDAVILSDVAVHQLGAEKLPLLREYVEQLGGGLIMAGGPNSFGVGGYYGSALQEVLPVRLRGPDHEEKQSSALALVIDRSGSMAGQKLEICKSAAIATADLLDDNDYIGIYAFDSAVHTVLPMTRVGSTASIRDEISLLSSSGGTNIYPGMTTARAELNAIKTKIRHMIVLTDGQTTGQDYQSLAAQCNAEGITISTVAVGAGAQVNLLQEIAAAGGGKAYVTMDPTAITRIFTQDTLVHTGRLIREEPFQVRVLEDHPMLSSLGDSPIPPLLGYVKTERKTTAQVPLVTDSGDPLLAHWRFGLGKVTAFTSDCKSRWAALWVQGWDGYSRFWSQVIRETARSPRSRIMDLGLREEAGAVTLEVDLRRDAGSLLGQAQVEARIFFAAADSIEGGMEERELLVLEQEGPGRYEASFHPHEAGFYLVRARSGADMVSAGYVRNPSRELATGMVDRDLLQRAAALTGGKLLTSAEEPVPSRGGETTRYVELRPFLLLAALALLLADLTVRRWENVLGVAEWFQGLSKLSRSAVK